MRKKIGTRIIISYTVIIVIVLAVLSVYFNYLVRETHLDLFRREMYEKLNFIDLVIREQPVQNLRGAQLRDMFTSMSRIIELRITIVTFQGEVIADTIVDDISTLENHLYRAEISRALGYGFGESVRFSNTAGTEMLYCAKKSDRFIIRLAKPLIEIENNLTRLRKIILAVGIITFITSFIIVILVSRKIVRPIEDTISFAKQFAEGNYSKRFLNYSEDELGELQRSLNKMADSLMEKISNLIFEQNKLSATLESISDGIAVIGNNKRILISNMAFSTYIDSPQKLTGKLYFEIIRSRKLNVKIEESIKLGNDAQFEDIQLNGRAFFFHITPIKEEATLQGILIVLHDITEMKKIEQMKTDLVGNMSHELKTPITIIKGYLETIQENLGNKEMCSSFIRKAIENADRQNLLINDILLLNELETSGDFVMEQINVRDIIFNCVELLKPKAAVKNIDVSLALNSLAEQVKGNKFLAEEIFFNIINNAISYNNPSGRVSIVSTEVDGRFAVEIRDTGIGIPDESRDRIFERFYRVDKSRSRATGGTGLGLSIVKHAVEILGWEIKVNSDTDGTVFTVEI